MSTFAFGCSHRADVEIDESTPFIAASDGDLNLLELSLKTLNVSPTLTDDNGLTPLHNAASYNQHEIIRWLLNQNVNVNAQDSDGDTPLHHCDHLNAAQILIEEGKADNKLKNNDGKTPLELKEDELKEMTEMDEDDDDDDAENLKQLVQYLKALS